MEKYKRRLLIIVAAFTIWSFVIVWLSFNLHALHIFGQNRIFFAVLAGACIVPIFFYYPIAKREPRLAVGLAVLAGGLVLYSIYAIAYFVLNLNDIWTDRVLDFGHGLCILACVIFIWQGVKKSRTEDGGASRS